MSEFTVSVTELAQFCHRSGDIDHRFTPSPTAVEGIAGHQQLYRRRGEDYRKEFPVEHQAIARGVNITLRGRADGYDPSAGVVEEIKTCRVNPLSIPNAISQLHFAQGRLYAAIIAQQEALAELTVRLTWFNIDTLEEHSEDQRYTRQALEGFLADSVDAFGQWLAELNALRTQRNDSARELHFPYGEFRQGQREISELVYKCVDQGGQLLLEAPTGIGKTAAVLYPAVKALSTGKHDKIVYATAKTVGRLVAQETLATFRQSGFNGAPLTLSAKEKVCFSPGKACHAQDCVYAQGYYDKLPNARRSALRAPVLGRDEVEVIAREHEVCPYQLAFDFLPWADLVIADFHYLYSLYGALGGQWDERGARWTVLLDEAHNLPDRARDMFQANLSKAALLAAKRAAPGEVARSLERINRRLLALGKSDWQEPDFDSSDDPPETLLRSLTDFTGTVGEQLGSDFTLLARNPDLGDFYFSCLHFLRVAQEWGPEYRCQLTRGSGRQSLTVWLNCLDPARLLGKAQQRAHSVSAFSATLSPLTWARKSLGLADTAVCARMPSPFAADQLAVRLDTDIDTRFRARDATLPALARRLGQWLRATPGNCILYFPSYRYLQDCLTLLAPDCVERTIWQQAPDQSEAERAELLHLLRERRDVAAACILGGVWGEGIDLPGEQLASVVVVGVGMPQVNRDTRELQEYFQHSVGNGFEFAFLYPGMQKVAQGLGRVVRTLSDSGSALLIDPRYAQHSYRALLPPWWHYEMGSD